MIQKEDCFQLGHVTKTIGSDGTLSIFFEDIQPDSILELESVLLEIDGTLVPFFLESNTIRKDKFLVSRFEDVYTESDAQLLVGKNVYVDYSALPTPEQNDFYEFEIAGFTVRDQDQNEVGVVERVVNTAGNIVFELKETGLMLPAHQDLIIDINRDEHYVQLEIPDGLLDLYE